MRIFVFNMLYGGYIIVYIVFKMKLYGKFKGVFIWLFNIVVFMYIRLKINKILYCRVFMRECIKNKFYYFLKCLELC